MSGHKRVWAQTCVGTNVSEHKRVWVQACVGTNVSGHKSVLAQMCVGTNVPGHKLVRATNVWSPLSTAHNLSPRRQNVQYILTVLN